MSERGPHIVIAGLMGVGKTSTAKALAEALGWPMRDSDADIESASGRTGAALVREVGVCRLHRYEADVLTAALSGDEATVVAAAGWVVEDPECRRLMTERSRVAVLDLDIGELMTRIASGDHRRPMTEAELRSAASRRSVLFDEVATWRLDARQSTVELVAQVAADVRGTT